MGGTPKSSKSDQTILVSRGFGGTPQNLHRYLVNGFQGKIRTPRFP